MFATWRRRIGLAVIAFAIAAALFAVFRPEAIPADFVTIASGDVVVTVNGEGVTRISNVFVVSSPLAGRAMRTMLEVGDKVSVGTSVVAAIRPTPPAFLNERDKRGAEARVRAAAAAMELAQAELVNAQAKLEFSLSDLSRATRLAVSQTVSARELDQAKLDVATKETAVASAKAQLAVKGQELESAQAVLIEPDSGFDVAKSGGECCVTLYAPQNGQVLKILHKSEGVVAAGAPLVEIGNPADQELVVDLLSADAVTVSQGDSAKIERWGGGQALNAVVRRVEPSGFTKTSSLGIEEQRVRVILDFTDPPERRVTLGHDFRVYARIAVETAKDVARVPLSALFRVKDDWAVFVVEEGRARQVSVQLGLRNTFYAEVSDGLENGQEVIIHPSDRVADGVLVTSRDGL